MAGEDARCGGVSPDSGAFLATANGELPGKEKIAFEQFVQGVYFRRDFAGGKSAFAGYDRGQISFAARREGDE